MNRPYAFTILRTVAFGSSIVACTAALQAEDSIYIGSEEEPDWAYEGDLSERVEANAITLALREATEIEMDEVLYEQVSSDLTKIYEAIPGLAAARARGNWVPSEIIVGLTTEIEAQLIAGTYEPWIELQKRFGSGVAEASYGTSPRWVFNLPGHLNSRRLAAEVAATWPGIRYAEPNGYGGDSGNIIYYPNARWYVFKLAWGDCPAGCIYSKFRTVAIEADGGVNELEDAEIIARSEFIGLNLPSPFRVTTGDSIPGAEATFAIEGAEGSNTVITRTKYERSRENEPWEWERSGFKISEDALSSSWRVRITYPYTNIDTTVDFTFEQMDRPTQELLGYRYRYGNGWFRHFHLGWINDGQYPWLWHSDYGWWYLSESGSTVDFWWVWSPARGWLGTSTKTGSQWDLDAEGKQKPRWFYEVTSQSWIVIE
jgi:hypothetical protein